MEYSVKWQGYHEKEIIWVVVRDIVNAKSLVKHFEELGLEVPIK